MRLPRFAGNHWHHHSRFYLSALLGVIVWAGTGAGEGPLFQDERLRLVLAGDVFYAAYLSSIGILAHRITLAELRKRSSIEDEGIVLIIVIILAAIAFSVASLFGIFHQKEAAPPLLLILSIASVPFGWFTLHLVLAMRYAHLYYVKATAKNRKGQDAGGLAFPGTDEPSGWDFVYHAFVVGMTAQVSDVDVTSTAMRKLTTAHSVVSFFYNTVLIALAVNIAVQNN